MGGKGTVARHKATGKSAADSKDAAGKKASSLRPNGASAKLTARGRGKKSRQVCIDDAIEEEPSKLKKLFKNFNRVVRWICSAAATLRSLVALIAKCYSMLTCRTRDPTKSKGSKGDNAGTPSRPRQVLGQDADASTQEVPEEEEEEEEPFRLMRLDSTCSTCSEYSHADGALQRTLSLPVLASCDADEVEDVLRRTASAPQAEDTHVANKCVDMMEVDYLQSFTNGETVFTPILGPDGQHLYTDGKQLYAAACVMVKDPSLLNQPAESASVSTRMSGTSADSDAGSE